MRQSQVIVGETYAVRRKGRLRPVEVLRVTSELGSRGGRVAVIDRYRVRWLDTGKVSERVSARRLVAPWTELHDAQADERCARGLRSIGVVSVGDWSKFERHVVRKF